LVVKEEKEREGRNTKQDKKKREGIQNKTRKKEGKKKRTSRSHTRPSGHRLVSSAYAIKTTDESSEV
jgi:hypothetical protein